MEISSSVNFSKCYQRLLQLLKFCSSIRSLDTTKSLHALCITLGPNSNQPIFLFNNITTFYSSLGHLSIARKLFDKMPDRNVVSFNTMISAYSRSGYVEEAWELFSMMRDYGLLPTQFTMGGLLSCQSLDICGGSQLQALVMKNGLFFVDAVVGTALLGLYGRYECVNEAFSIFSDLPKKNSVTWNSIISLFGHNGFVKDCMLLFRQVLKMELPLTELSFLGILCGFEREQDLELGEQIHSLVIKKGFVCEVSVANSLLSMYVKCAHICLAEELFEEMCARDTISWNIIIGAEAKNKNPIKAVEHFLKMSMEGLVPNSTTFVNVIASCTILHFPVFGESIHAKTVKNAFESDVFVGSSLVDFYAKCHKLEDAHHCFDRIYEKNLVSWNTLILGYANHRPGTASSLLKEMLQLGYRPNEVTFSSLLILQLAVELKQLHSLIVRMGYGHDEYVQCSLMNSYAKNDLISDALVFVTACDCPLAVVPSNAIAGIYNRSGEYYKTLKLLSTLEEPDTVSWNIALSACARAGAYKEVFELFRHMLMAQLCPDNYTFVSLLSACSKLCNLALGSSVHGLMVKADFNLCDTFVCNILIDMYGKCGSLENSVKVFDKMMDRNLITWTALISAFGINGYAYEALERFRQMDSLGFKPDSVTFIALFTVCRHAGLVKEGMEFFRRMSGDYGVEPEMDHFHCVVDLLARYGHLKEAEQLISSMPFPPDVIIWRSFLEGCKQDRTVERFKQLDI
ncbi:hypothetical protein SLEP1_g44857 [Rubroshorea leprosula]|uniref:Pentatricopeptide repeat-containing protein n=1 Tax=Rubroshorea leprosula TaxID=152421 RepID=A0AAV5LHW6_9ROSI|nr:hypothetical protein SLEP1_g44857 [Rubroshorea leprosula]